VSNPYEAPRSDPSIGGTPERAGLPFRRVVAGSIDAAPVALTLLVTTAPVLAAAWVLGIQVGGGFRLFNPGLTSEPALHRLMPGHPALALACASWLLLQTIALLTGRRSIGKRLMGLRLATTDGQPPSRGRALGREVLRSGLAIALLAAGLLGPSWLGVQPFGFDDPDRGQAPALAAIIAVCALALIGHVLADFLLVVGSDSRRSLVDRFARTAVRG
jgi:uncharacterized RDD family membrane protein YckC